MGYSIAPLPKSTQAYHTSHGLYYYGYRYYDAVNGGWLNRDPIEERGGVNLYGFVGNDGLNAWDYLGMNKKRAIFYLGGEGNMWDGVDPFAPDGARPSAQERSRVGYREASKTKKYSGGNDIRLTAEARLSAVSNGVQISKGEGYDSISVTGTAYAEYSNFGWKWGEGETATLTVNQDTKEISVKYPPNPNRMTDDPDPFGEPGSEGYVSTRSPYGSAGLMLIDDENLSKKVTIKFKVSAVATMDKSAYPDGFGTYLTPHSRQSITWYRGGYKRDFSKENRLIGVETDFVSLKFEIRCID